MELLYYISIALGYLFIQVFIAVLAIAIPVGIVVWLFRGV